MDKEEFEVEQVEEPIEEDSVEGGRRIKRKKLKNKSRKTNNALKEWVAFVKKVQKEEKIDSYKKAMSRAKVRADKGEKWRSMKGGDGGEELDVVEDTIVEEDPDEKDPEMSGGIILGGKRRTRRRSASRTRRRSASRTRRRSARRSRGRSARRSRGRH